MAKVSWGPFTIDAELKKTLEGIIKNERAKDVKKNKSVRSKSAIIEYLLRRAIKGYSENAGE